MTHHYLPDESTLQHEKYTIKGILGQGGFGITYKAYFNQLKAYVAIKEFFIRGKCVRNTGENTISPQSIEKERFDDYKKRFIDEARLIYSFRHPNIVRISDVFEENNTATGQTPIEATDRIDEENPATDHLIPPNKLNPNISINTTQTILKAMKLSGRQRFQSAKEFIKALKNPERDVYESLISTANELYNQKKYNDAVVIYRNALAAKSEDKYAEKQIENCRKHISQLVSPAVQKKMNQATNKKTTNIKSIAIDKRTFYKFVHVKGGVFEMGDEELTNSKPVHNVEVSDFYIGLYPVTNLEFCVFLKEHGDKTENGMRFLGMKIKKQALIDLKTSRIIKKMNVFIPDLGYEHHPVVAVNWYGANKFCEWLSDKANRDIRLPTKTEWEYAASSGGTEKWAGTNKEIALMNYAWFDYNASSKTHPVGQKKPNSLGIFDMSGNVREWCYDWFEAYTTAQQKNPEGALEGEERVLRGGSWFSKSVSCRTTHRGS